MKDCLYILYKFIQVENSSALYRYVRVFTQDGEVEINEVEDAFTTKEELVLSVQDLLDKLGKTEAFILSVEDFNIGIEAGHNMDSFKSIFDSYGALIESNGPSEKSRSLFGRFF